jgi:hypothetical protein
LEEAFDNRMRFEKRNSQIEELSLEEHLEDIARSKEKNQRRKGVG